MRRDVTASGAWTGMVVEGLESLGLDVHGLCQLAKVPYAALVDPDARVPYDQVTLLWRAAERRTGDRNLGLHAAERVRPVVNHIHSHLILSSRNLRDGIAATLPTLPLLGHGVGLELEEMEDAFFVHFEHARGDLPAGRHAVEFAAVIVRAAYGMAFDGPLPLRRVEFAHPHPGDHREHERVLGCPVHFASRTNALVVDREVMLRPSRHHSAELARRMLEVADSHLSRLSQPSFSSELRAILRARLEDGPCDADSIAAELHMGLRTLQRRLEAEGMAFSEVLDGARREVALELIAADLPVRDLAMRCGFSGSRALIRAFRRWTGSTPAAYREGARDAKSRPAEPSRS
jgi:AraC-like DNA-binding protein